MRGLAGASPPAFTFPIAGRERLRADAGGTIEFRVRSELSSRLFEEVLIDIGFSDPLGGQPERVRGSDLLAFADIEPIEALLIVREDSRRSCRPNEETLALLQGAMYTFL